MVHFFKIRILACFLVLGIAGGKAQPVSFQALPQKFLQAGVNVKNNVPFLMKRVLFFTSIMLVGLAISPEKVFKTDTLGGNFALGNAMYELLSLSVLLCHIPFISHKVGSWVRIFVTSISSFVKKFGFHWLSGKLSIFLPWVLSGFLKFLAVALCVGPIMDAAENKFGNFLGHMCGKVSGFFKRIFRRRFAF